MMDKEVLDIRSNIVPTQGGAPFPVFDSVPLLDITGENQDLRDELSAAMHSVLDSGRFVLGSEVTALEQEIAAVCDTQHAIGCASGSDSLLLSLMACDIGPGDEVIVPSFTFFATASAVSRLGAVPIFADIDPETFNITAATIEAVATPRTKAIIPVHLFGLAAEMDAIMAFATERDLYVIEDAAQAIGACHGGRPVGSIGHIGCFSFYPTKNLGGFGDGGMLTTNDTALAERLQLLRGHGMKPRYYHQEVGINSRLDSLQAAMLRVKLPHLSAWSRRRQANAALYDQLFRDAALDQLIQLPTAADREQHVWNQYTIRLRDNLAIASTRDGLRSFLNDLKIGTEIYYPVPLHEQACFDHLDVDAADLQETTAASREVLSIPVHARLTRDEQQYVVRCVAKYFSQFASRESAA